MPVDAVVNAMLNLGSGEEADLAEPIDPMQQFRENALLAGQLGGWDLVEALHDSLADVNARADAIFREPRRSPNAILAQASSPDRDAEVVPASHRLAKHTAGSAFSKVSENGRWRLEFDTAGILIAGHEIETER